MNLKDIISIEVSISYLYKKSLLTIDNQFASSFIGVTDALEVAGVSDLSVLDHNLALATLLYDRYALVCFQRFIVLEPGEDIKIGKEEEIEVRRKILQNSLLGRKSCTYF